MTKKELCRRALRDWDNLVDVVIGTKFADLENVLKTHNYSYKKTTSGEIKVKTKNATFTIGKHTKNNVIYSNMVYDFFVKGIGIVNFNLACKTRGACNRFIVELQNTDDLTDISFYEVETTRTMKQFERYYKQVRNRWLKSDDDLPPLINYLETELLELGFGIYQIHSDLVLDF